MLYITSPNTPTWVRRGIALTGALPKPIRFGLPFALFGLAAASFFARAWFSNPLAHLAAWLITIACLIFAIWMGNIGLRIEHYGGMVIVIDPELERLYKDWGRRIAVMPTSMRGEAETLRFGTVRSLQDNVSDNDRPARIREIRESWRAA